MTRIRLSCIEEKDVPITKVQSIMLLSHLAFKYLHRRQLNRLFVQLPLVARCAVRDLQSKELAKLII